jgi:hypothetical protein
MIKYVGNTTSPFTNSLYICLRAAGTDEWVTPGLIECLGGIAFGAMYLRFDDVPRFFPNSPNNNPDSAVCRALALLGWTCDETRGGDAGTALERLRTASFPAQAGPCNIEYMTHNFRHSQLKGDDTFVTVLGIEEEFVRLHDPGGYPLATLPVNEFVQAWRADGIDFGPVDLPLNYVLRSNFRVAESLSREQIIRRGVEIIRDLIAVPFGGPHIFGGSHAFRALAENMRGVVPPELRDLLVDFSLAAGAQRSLDAVPFLAAASLDKAAAYAEQKARLYGETFYNAVNCRWLALAEQLEQLAEIEEAFVKAMM